LEFLLAKELPLHSVMRLWDTYFASDEGLRMHPYVCLAILAACKEEFMETEHPELVGMLEHLPLLDMDMIITQAYNIREEVMASGLIRDFV